MDERIIHSANWLGSVYIDGKSMIPEREDLMENNIHAEIINESGAKVKIVNLTPHKITFVTDKGNLSIDPSGELARVSAKVEETGHIYVTKFGISVPITETTYGEVEGLPDPKENTIFVVSSLVAQRVPEREDVFIPSESVRDEKGRIIGCKSLGHI